VTEGPPKPGQDIAKIRVLLVQDNPEYTAHLNDAAPESSQLLFELRAAATLAEAMEALSREKFDAILLELSLPDSSGMNTFKTIRAAAPSSPVVILTYLDDELLALQAVREGAQDYLLKSEFDTKSLRRVLLYSIERHRMQMRLFSLSVMDDLTGLYNRRGFMILAEQQMRLASRSRKGLLFFMSDLDGLKAINDGHGHRQGDLALQKTAELLRQTFRKSDILARLGGDEFAALAVEADFPESGIIAGRLEANIREFNRQNLLPFSLSLSTGFAHFDSRNSVFVEQLIAQADRALYEQKKTRQKAVTR
jgi:diguanylate cyclase (GGDEF)-like protein